MRVPSGGVVRRVPPLDAKQNTQDGSQLSKAACLLHRRHGSGPWRSGWRVSFTQRSGFPGPICPHWNSQGLTCWCCCFPVFRSRTQRDPNSPQFFRPGVTIRGDESSYLRAKTRRLFCAHNDACPFAQGTYSRASLIGPKHAEFALESWNLWGILYVAKLMLGWQAGRNSMKTMYSNQKVVQFPPRGRAGMTLVEVVIALAITGLTVGGIVAGYIYCTTAAVKVELAQAASARAMERIEETRQRPMGYIRLAGRGPVGGHEFSQRGRLPGYARIRFRGHVGHNSDDHFPDFTHPADPENPGGLHLAIQGRRVDHQHH